MQRTGEWGEFFPMELSPHAYNTSVAADYFPLDRDAALLLGAKWYEPESQYGGAGDAIVPDVCPEDLRSYLNRVFLCAASGQRFKFTEAELKFYREQSIPLPDLCFKARHERRLKRRAPRKTWDRVCAGCRGHVASVFAPNRPETVYCPKCFADSVG